MNDSRNASIVKIAIPIISAFQQKEKPANLVTRINVELEELGLGETTSREIASLIVFNKLPSGVAESQLNSLAIYLQVQWHKFIKMAQTTWSSTEVNSDERALEVLELFGFNSDEAKTLSIKIPGPFPEVIGVFEGKRKNWYTSDVKNRASYARQACSTLAEAVLRLPVASCGYRSLTCSRSSGGRVVPAWT